MTRRKGFYGQPMFAAGMEGAVHTLVCLLNWMQFSPPVKQ